MNALRMTAILIVVVYLLGGKAAQPTQAAQPGNIELEVNHHAVLDGQVRVCDTSANLPDDIDDYGVQQWNEAIGATILTADCSTTGGYRGVTVKDVVNGFCGYSDGPANTQPKPACALFPPAQDRPNPPLEQYWTPLAAGYAPGFQQTIIVHELGHNLGLQHGGLAVLDGEPVERAEHRRHDAVLVAAYWWLPGTEPP